ncbi:hypothetical protein KKC16_03360, partial [Patescibacteria group bacterium]|nr:hypothetical protein [Patescibacteria group bacterium]
TQPLMNMSAGDLLIGNNATTTGSHYIGGDLSVAGTSNFTGDMTLTGDLQANSVTSTDSIYLGGFQQFTEASDNYIYFDNAQTNYLRWLDSSDQFEFSNGLNITSATTTDSLNVTGTLAVATTTSSDFAFQVGSKPSIFQNGVSILGYATTSDIYNLGRATTTAQAYFGNTLRIAGASQIFMGSASIITETNDLTLNPASNLILNPETGTIQFQDIAQTNSNIYSTAGILFNQASTTALTVQDGSGNNVFNVDTTNGVVAITGDLTVSANATTSGYLVIGTTQPLMNMSAGDLLIGNNATTTGSHYIAGTASTTQLFVQGTGHIGGNTTLDGSLTLLGAADFNSTLDVAGATDLAASGLLTNIRGTLSVDEAAVFDSTLVITGNATTSNSLWIGTGGSPTTLDLAGGDLYVQDDVHIDGQCVTGDTVLPIVRVNNIEYVRIDEIKGGEYVMSLNEKTGLLEPARINGLLDMGVKPIYKLTTESGKQIRTTGNHPYLVKNQTDQNLFLNGFGFSFVNIKNQASKDSHYNSANDEQDVSKIHISKNKLFFRFNSNNRKNNAKQTCQYENNNNALCECFAYHNFSSDLEKVNAKYKHNNTPEMPIKEANNLTNVGLEDGTTWLTATPKNNPLAMSAKKLDSTLNWGLDNSNIVYPQDNNSIENIENANWTKVAYLNKGDEIAVANENNSEVIFEKIISIELLPSEQVYDIEVEGTHNFVANGIIAHNTYINNNATTTGSHYIAGTAS